MEREDEDATQQRRRLFRRALSSLLGSIEAAAAARACRAFVLTFGFYDYFLSYGIVELVEEIQSRIPSAIYNTNLRKRNVLLIAVINKQPLVIEKLWKIISTSKPKVWENMVLATDYKENTMLHLAAKQPLGKDKPWGIAGSALQMMWEIKWFKEISKVKEAISIANNACWSIGELAAKIQEKKIKKSSDMNVDHLKAVENGYSSSNSSSSIPYIANGGIPSLKLSVVVVLWPFS